MLVTNKNEIKRQILMKQMRKTDRQTGIVKSIFAFFFAANISEAVLNFISFTKRTLRLI
jgi:beta-lactamase regulating signal transducer with metallopeptidase domain